ncbi:MAG: PfkB family carbohydrate kinase [Myxococcota bacterium]
MTHLDLVGAGSMVVDLLHRVPRLIGADEKLLVDPGPGERFVEMRVGGVTLNHLGWASVLGLRVGLFGKQADDADGRFLREGMDRLGIEHAIDLSGSASSRAEVFVDAAGERAIYMLRGATAELEPDEVERLFAPLIQRARIFSTEVSQLPLRTVHRALELARASGASCVIDLDVPVSEAVPALGSPSELDHVLALADVLKPSRAALAGLVSTKDPLDAARELALRYGCRQGVVTLGSEGAVIWSGDETGGEGLRVAAARPRVIDTTGSGDAFLGGFIAGMRLGLDPRDCARLGNACGAACCERLGAFPDDPSGCRARVVEHLAGLGLASLQLPPLAATASSAPGGEGREGREGAGGDPLERFLEVARHELEALCRGTDRAGLRAAADLIVNGQASGGRVHVTGIGKPEHVARYAAALFSSTGTPATFLHGTEATHGSVGQMRRGDLLIAISNSGETGPLLACVQAARDRGVRIVAVTGAGDSTLARAADRVLRARVAREGGPLDLAPRASVLAEAMLLAALSVELQARRGFTREDYHRSHPSGRLGQRSG